MHRKISDCLCTAALCRWDLMLTTRTHHYFVQGWGWQGCRVGITPWKVAGTQVLMLEGRALERHMLGWLVLEWCRL